ncbi:MAG: hypothetical protein LUQ65_12370, partial [Candidatus Helarchaeota archaeon]|nr:hypothetical protein [Candidatus Helarchaeota archaeon]
MRKALRILFVAGARPNFMKIAPIISAIKKFNNSINPSAPKSEVASAQGVNEGNPAKPENETRDPQLVTCNFISTNPINYILV